jgi:hypothetical protein
VTMDKRGKSPSALAVDVCGSHVKALHSGESERRRFDSGPDLTPQEMVRGVLTLAEGWSFDRVTVGIPTPVRGGKAIHKRPQACSTSLGSLVRAQYRPPTESPATAGFFCR